MTRTEYERRLMAFNRGLLDASTTHRPSTGPVRGPQAEQDKSGKSLSGRGGLVAAPSSLSGEVGGGAVPLWLRAGYEDGIPVSRSGTATAKCSEDRKGRELGGESSPASPPKLVAIEGGKR